MALTVALYAVPITGFGKDVVVIASAAGGFTVKVSVWLAVIFVEVEESVTVKVTELPLPAPVGVPEMTPVLLLKLKPAGRVPEVIAHV